MNVAALLRMSIAGGFLALVGCTTQLNVTYATNPPGASVFQNGRLIGYAPVTVEYPISPSERRAGRVSLEGMNVKWASGAAANTGTLQADLRNGSDQIYTVERPNVPGKELDWHVGLERQKLAAMQRQADAAEAAVIAQALDAAAANYARARTTPPPPAPAQPLQCESRVSGHTIFTDCK